MGKIDSMAKKYFRNPVRFAATFNYLIYNGAPVINPSHLTPLDSTEVTLVEKKYPVQKYRDLLDEWEIMEDDNAVYVLLGGELQSYVHYAIPVKDCLYDAINYGTQVSIISQKYKDKKEAEITVDENGIRIRLTKDEFLSGLRKGDKLKPIITAAIYLGTGEWDGPLSLHEMLYFPDERMKAFVPDYRINLISPKDMVEADFDRMGETDLGFLMKVLKLGNVGFGDMFSEERYKNVNADSAILANEIAKLGLKIKVTEKGDVDMCRAMVEQRREDAVVVAARMARRFVKDETAVIDSVANELSETTEYVETILKKNQEKKIPVMAK